MDTGFITLHRKITENPIWENSQLMHLFLTLLLWANHEEKKTLFNGKVEIIGRGQLITGRFKLAEATGIPAGSIPRYLDTLRKLEIINTKSNNKFTLITIIKYSEYQTKKEKVNTKPNNQRTPSEHPVNTNNNVTMKQESVPTQASEFFTSKEKQAELFKWLVSTGVAEELARTELWEFIKYWKETSAKGKERWQGQKFFDVKRRVGTWFKNIK